MQNYRLDQSGWLPDQTRCIPSPNFNERPPGCEISLLVIHNISLPPGKFGSGCIEHFFCNQLDHSAHPFFEEIRGVRVSAHFLIDRAGRVTQFVPLGKRAWHAGVSCFDGREGCNDFSVGIELEGEDELAYTVQQYASLVELTLAIQQACPAITLDRIVGHRDIAPGRKTDPGVAFDWENYRNGLLSASAQGAQGN